MQVPSGEKEHPIGKLSSPRISLLCDIILDDVLLLLLLWLLLWLR